jgi:hypothetical protein
MQEDIITKINLTVLRVDSIREECNTLMKGILQNGECRLSSLKILRSRFVPYVPRALYHKVIFIPFTDTYIRPVI